MTGNHLKTQVVFGSQFRKPGHLPKRTETTVYVKRFLNKKVLSMDGPVKSTGIRQEQVNMQGAKTTLLQNNDGKSRESIT